MSKILFPTIMYVFLSASADHSQNIGSYNFVEPESPNQVTDNVGYFL